MFRAILIKNNKTMNLNQFLNDNLVVINEIIKNIHSEQFDSHKFIGHFAKRFERDYVVFLCNFEEEPFRKVYAQIAKFLAENQVKLKIKDDGRIYSSFEIYFWNFRKGIEKKPDI